MKIVILDGYCANPGDLSWEPLKEFGELVVYPRTSADEVVSRIGDAEIVITNKTVLDAAVLSQLSNIKYIGVLATGFNTVDIDAARSRGIVVTNVPAYSTDSVAQMTFAHILNITNRVAHYASQNREGRWSAGEDFCYADTPLTELAGKTLGIVGLGNIGRKVARIAMDFGMDVFAFTSKHISELPEGIQKTTMKGLLAASDVLTLHCPLTDTTRNLINRDTIALMRRGAIIINTSRGPVVNESDVAEALESGQLAAYGADVMCSEPPSADNPLFKQPHAYITPHIAWATREARARLVKCAIDNVKAFMDGSPVNVVNP